MRTPLMKLLVISAVFGFVTASYAQQKPKSYVARPTISKISPERGEPGTEVSIEGRAFSDKYTIWLSGIELKPVKITSDRIVVKLPEGVRTGRIQLKGPHIVESRQVFWVVEKKQVPVIKDFSPKKGAPGAMITIDGSNFGGKIHENVVTLGQTAVTVTAATRTRLTVTIPRGAKTDHFKVQVKDAGTATTSKKFKVLEALMIEKTDPLFGPPETKVKITGTGFNRKASWNTVTLAGQKVKVKRASSESLEVQIPKGASTGRFIVSVRNGGKAESPTEFRVVFPPTISKVVPLAGPPGTEVAVSGTNFGNVVDSVNVTLAGKPVKIIEVTDTLVRTVIPQGGVSGRFRVSVERQGTAESKKQFDVWTPLSVTKMEPASGTPGTTVTLTGTGFRTKTKDHNVYMGPEKIKVTDVGDGKLSFKIPDDAPDGSISFRVEVIDRGEATVPTPFYVFRSPQITSFEPSRGPAGTRVTLKGKYFGTMISHVRVLIGSQICRVTSVVPDKISLMIPNGAKTGPFEVQTRRRGNDTSKDEFEVYEPVRITGVLPSAGYEGMKITVFGGGFDTNRSRNKVMLNGKKVKVVSANSSKIEIIVPNNATSGKVTIEVPKRGNAVSPKPFDVVEKVEVLSFSPEKGVPGTIVNIKGKGFANQGLRAWIDKTPIGLRVINPQEIIVQIPPGAENGKFIVHAPRAGRSESLRTFKVEVPLTVSGFEPTWGPPGQKVIIKGTGFKPGKNTRVTIGGMKVKVSHGTDTSLYVIVPRKAQSSPFLVSVRNRGEVESEEEFTVYEKPPAGAPAAPAPAQAASYPVQQTPAATPPPRQAQQTAAPAPVQAAPVQTPPKPRKYLIKSLDPLQAVVGDQIMISGSGFGMDQSIVKAWVGNVAATVIGALPDMIMIEVPAGVRRGKIRIQVGKGPVVKSKQVLKVTQ